ncbi:MAG TPA: glycosyltransferase family A protein [Flavobacterium sp.]|nr:glycosyltransferase family A protein [Flavobacterium sp.]
MGNATKISVIVPCYNQAQYLSQALESVYAQSYSNWECVIVNDGGSDNSAAVANEWVAKDSRFLYLEKENGGLASARSFGIAHSDGAYIFPLDGDDFVEAHYFSEAAAILDNNPDVEIVHCKVMQFGAVEGELKLDDYSFEKLLQRNSIIACSFFRRASYEKTNGYCTGMKILEDWDLWISILANGGKVHKIDQFYYHYRKHSQGSLINTFATDRERYEKHVDIIYKNHLDTYLQYWGNPILARRETLEKEAFHKKTTSSLLYKTYKFPKILIKWLQGKR